MDFDMSTNDFNPIIKHCSWFYCIFGLLNVSLYSFANDTHTHLVVPFPYSVISSIIHLAISTHTHTHKLTIQFEFQLKSINFPCFILEYCTNQYIYGMLGMPASIQSWTDQYLQNSTETIAIYQNNQFIIACVRVKILNRMKVCTMPSFSCV